MRLGTVALGATWLASACGHVSPQEAGSTVEEVAGVLVDRLAADDVSLDLTGRWARLLVQTAESRAPVVGTVRTQTRAFGIWDLVHVGETVTGELQICALEVDSSVGVSETIVPEAYVRAIPARRTDGVVLRGPSGWEVEFARAWDFVGLTGMEAESPMPTSAGDPRVADADGDGHPGVTIEVRGLGGGEMYFVQRTWRELRSTSVTSDRLDGVVVWGSERVVLDATSRALRAPRETEPILGGQESYFRMVRVAPGATCEEVVGIARGLMVGAGSGNAASPSSWLDSGQGWRLELEAG